LGKKLQFIKDEIRQRIIDAAREEFLKKGFEKASVRTICFQAKTSKSNLYNYFKNKDRLFCSILEPTLAKIYQGFELAKSFNLPKEVDSYTKESQKFVIGVVTDFVSENLTDVKLLLFHARGSSLESFRDRVIDAFTDVFYDWVRSIRSNKEISKFFARCVSNFYLSIIEQTILSVTTKEQAENLGEEFLNFVYHGWKGVFQ
jgi:AcrR family transcriptional regulator